MITATTTFLAMLCVGAWVLLRNYESNRLNKVLIGVIAFWIVLFGSNLVGLYNLDEQMQDVACLLEYRRMYMGMMSLFVYMAYPVVAVYPRFFISPNVLLSLAPFVVSCIVYHIWCHIFGLDPFFHFTSLDMLLAPENRGLLIFRSVIFICFFGFFFASLYSFWCITKLYQRYIDGVYSDAEYNIVWLKNYLLSMALIGGAFFVVAIYTSVETYWFYIFGATVNFYILCENALKFNQFERSKEYEVCWSFAKRWHVKHNDELMDQLPSSASVVEDQTFCEFDKWIRSVEAYDHCSFTLNEVREQFPNLDYIAMERQLAARGYTFQSYIRKMRIERALEIIESDDKISVKEVAYKVGFSHQSSFSRAFFAEKGCTPREYKVNQSR